MGERGFSVGEIDDDRVGFQIRFDLFTHSDAETTRGRNFPGVFSQSGATWFINRGNKLKGGALCYRAHNGSAHSSTNAADNKA